MSGSSSPTIMSTTQASLVIFCQSTMNINNQCNVQVYNQAYSMDNGVANQVYAGSPTNIYMSSSAYRSSSTCSAGALPAGAIAGIISGVFFLIVFSIVITCVYVVRARRRAAFVNANYGPKPYNAPQVAVVIASAPNNSGYPSPQPYAQPQYQTPVYPIQSFRPQNSYVADDIGAPPSYSALPGPQNGRVAYTAASPTYHTQMQPGETSPNFQHPFEPSDTSQVGQTQYRPSAPAAENTTMQENDDYVAVNSHVSNQ